MASRFLAPLGFGRGLPSQRRGIDTDPFIALQREMNRLFEDVTRSVLLPEGGQAAVAVAPRIDVREAENAIHVMAEMPGVKAEDVDVTLEEDMLILRGEKRDERERDEQNFHIMERSFGQFQRAIQLPFIPDPEKVEANFENGVLTIMLEKQPQQQQRRRRIEVRGGGAENVQPRINEARADQAIDARAASQDKAQERSATGQESAGEQNKKR